MARSRRTAAIPSSMEHDGGRPCEPVPSGGVAPRKPYDFRCGGGGFLLAGGLAGLFEKSDELFFQAVRNRHFCHGFNGDLVGAADGVEFAAQFWMIAQQLADPEFGIVFARSAGSGKQFFRRWLHQDGNSRRRMCSLARLRRDITVPMGISRTSAMSR